MINELMFWGWVALVWLFIASVPAIAFGLAYLLAAIIQ